jgi:hypothetical protein
MLRCERMENWNWNERDALDARRQASAAKQVLEVFVAGQALTNAVDRRAENVRAMIDKLGEALEAGGVNGGASFAPLAEDAARVRETLAADLAQKQRLDDELAKLAVFNADIPAILAALADLGDHATPWVARLVPKVLEPARKLQGVAEVLRANMAAVQRLEFAAVNSQPAWPTVDECSAHPSLGAQRAQLEKSLAGILETARQVEALTVVFKRLGVEPPAVPPVIASAHDHAVWEDVFTCGILKLKLPNRMRKEPVDVYDRLLSVEGFYELLYGMPEKTGEAMLEGLDFTPELVALKRMYAQFNVFLAFMQKKGNGWVVAGGGPLPEMVAFCEKQLAARDALLVWLAGQGDKDAGMRTSLIGRGAALYLAPGGLFGDAVRVALAEDFKAFRARLHKLNQEFDAARPEDGIQIRDRVLAEGLPGDPVVRKMWAKRE